VKASEKKTKKRKNKKGDGKMNNVEEVLRKLEDLVETYRYRIEQKEAELKVTENSEKRHRLTGYVEGTLRAKWDLQDLISEIKKGGVEINEHNI